MPNKKLIARILLGSFVPAVLFANLAKGEEPQAPNDTRTVIKLSPEMLQVIGQALSEMPYKTSAPVLQELQHQLLLPKAPSPNPMPVTAATPPAPTAPN